MQAILKYVHSHIEVYDEAGRFLFSADTQEEALKELEQQKAA